MVSIVGVFGSYSANRPSEMVKRMSDAIAHRGQERFTTLNQATSRKLSLIVRSPTTRDYHLEHTREHTFLVCSWCLDSDVIAEVMRSGSSLLDIDRPHAGREAIDALILRFDQAGLTITRSKHSMNPMYYHWSEGNIAFSTEKKALWSVGLSNVMELEPGQVLRTGPRETQSPVTTQEREYPEADKKRSRKDLLASLQSRLEESFRCLQGIENIGVLFSGGVDSSLAALLARKICRQVTLFTACSEGSHDSDSASAAAEALDMELEIAPFDAEEAWQILPEVIYATETNRYADIEIALPFFIASRAARNSGISIMVSGQGPDELFAGYEKHVRLFMDRGEGALDNELRSEIENTNRANIERDEKAIAYNGLSAFFPYLSSQFVSEALTVPSRWKVTPGKNPERKVIFRELAINMGLPEEIALRPKKATQYSSGSQRIIRKAISEKVRLVRKSEMKKGALEQIVIDGIAQELGMPTQGFSDVELDFDLRPVRKLVQDIQRTSRQQ